MNKTPDNTPVTTDSTADAISMLVINLNRFNASFAENSRRLGDSIDRLGQSGAGPASPALSEAEFAKMAELQAVTLQKINTLVDTYLNELTRAAAVTDATMRDALARLKDSTAANVDNLSHLLVEQSDRFKRVLDEERRSFEAINDQIAARFNQSLDRMPHLAEQLQQLADIPARLDTLIQAVTESQTAAMVNVNRSIRQALTDATTAAKPAPARPSILSIISTVALVIAAVCLVIIAFK
ncbi:MAG: hypothetical protein J1E63_10840 [Muribaculaceae bacterium]|nr:hypothetical protein [Muribaculaceae bacterium]